MRQKLAVFLGALAAGLLAARFLRRRRAAERAKPSAQTQDPRADALRRQLAASRETTETSPATPAEPAAGIDDARRRVHEHGRAAVDEMRRSAG